MNIGTHNSMTYLPPKHWWLFPFKFIAKCQSIPIEMQYELGARMFDLRVTFDKYGYPEFRHGAIAYKSDVYETLRYLNEKNVLVRLVLETKKEDKRQEELFVDFCSIVEHYFTNIKFFCGTRKFDWKRLYEFKIKDIDLTQKISSMTGTILDDWWPWLYARFNNKKNISNHKSDDWLLIDFIEIR